MTSECNYEETILGKYGFFEGKRGDREWNRLNGLNGLNGRTYMDIFKG